ncbi:MAG: VWA domain-containing protein [Pseudomonadota bacterium]
MLHKRIAAIAAVALSALFGVSSADARTIDLGFSLDTSGSVGSADFAVARTALAQALSNIPTTGPVTYRIAVTKFSSSVTTVVPVTQITGANIGAIQTAIANTAFVGGATRTADAITTTFDLFAAVGLGDTTLINITTDGEPFEGTRVGAVQSQLNAEAAALAAFNNGLDGLSFETVGTFSATDLNNAARIAGFGTAGVASNGVVLAPTDAIPDPTQTGFVLPVASFAGYSAAIDAKVEEVVINTQVVPLPAGLPLMLAGIAAFAFVRRRQTG